MVDGCVEVYMQKWKQTRGSHTTIKFSVTFYCIFSSCILYSKLYALGHGFKQGMVYWSWVSICWQKWNFL